MHAHIPYDYAKRAWLVDYVVCRNPAIAERVGLALEAAMSRQTVANVVTADSAMLTGSNKSAGRQAVEYGHPYILRTGGLGWDVVTDAGTPGDGIDFESISQQIVSKEINPVWRLY
jgi:hypothetical protein